MKPGWKLERDNSHHLILDRIERVKVLLFSYISHKVESNNKTEELAQQKIHWKHKPNQPD